jgi:AraC-like DNA-binding protein
LPYDKQLVEKAIKVTEAHLLDENFTVEQLASELNFSRSSLHRKLRDLTNQSATEFIRSVRLNKAVALMKQGNYNMEEIAYAVGFSSPSYFSQSFKKQFNQSPKAYLEELKQQVGMN